MKRTIAFLFVAGLAARGASAQVPVGGEFRVNTQTLGDQAGPRVASAADGSFVVVWTGEVTYGGALSSRVFARRYDAAGVPESAPDFHVLSPTTAGIASIAAQAEEGFVVAWERFEAQIDISARRFDAALLPIGDEVAVNAYTAGHHIDPSVAPAPDGGFVVAWERHAPDYTADVFARMFDAAGAPLGGDIQVNTYTTSRQEGASVATDAQGNFVVVWESYKEDGDGWGVFGQRYDSGGVPRGSPFKVNAYTIQNQYFPVVASDPAGNFVVVWANRGETSPYWDLFGRRYDATGAPLGLPFQVNAYTLAHNRLPSIAMASDGAFVVAWQGSDRDNSLDAIVAREFDASGTPLTGDFIVNTYTTFAQRAPAVAMDAKGNFVVVWQSDRQDSPFDYGVFGQRFLRDRIFRDGFGSGTLANWSSAETDGGDLGVSAAAGLNSTSEGLQAFVDDTRGLFVQDDTPRDEDRYRARFYFDPNGFDPGEGLGHRRTRIFLAFEEAPARRVAALVLRRVSGAYGLMLRARLDDNSQADTPFTPISDDPHVVELDWRRSSAPGALDGSLELWIDGVSVAALANLDNSISTVDFVRMGALGVKAGAGGSMYWDEFESRRVSYIGP